MKNSEEKLAKIKIYTGTPATPYEIIGTIKAKAQATSAFSKAPTEDDVNWKLREKALKLGANAVINVAYDRQAIGLTSWKSLTARGEAAVIRERAPTPAAPEVLAICPECYERVPLGSKFCTGCGAEMQAKEETKEGPEVLAICPKCYERVPLDSKFCPECGASIKSKK